MDKMEKEAYLLLLHRAFVEIRSKSSTYQHQWWNPFRWKTIYKHLKQINMLAETFHNLPLLLESNDFNKKEFWQQIGIYERQFSILKEDSYIETFEKHFKA